jgi:hypothetical protein
MIIIYNLKKVGDQQYQVVHRSPHLQNFDTLEGYYNYWKIATGYYSTTFKILKNVSCLCLCGNEIKDAKVLLINSPNQKFYELVRVDNAIDS